MAVLTDFYSALPLSKKFPFTTFCLKFSFNCYLKWKRFLSLLWFLVICR
jgi:hypothetical protein